MHILDLFSRKPPSAGKRLELAVGDDSDAGGRRTQASLSHNIPSTAKLPPYLQLYVPRSDPGPKTQGSASEGTLVTERQQGREAYLVGQASDSKAPTTSSETPSPPAAPTVATPAVPTPDGSSPPTAPVGKSLGTAPPDGPSSSSSPLGLKGPLGLKDCKSRACAGVVDTFRRALQKDTSPAHASTSAAAPMSSTPSSTSLHPSSTTDSSSDTTFSASADSSAELCPPDTGQLGRATWTFLHSVAAHYPDHPTEHQQQLMRAMMEGVVEFYPCQVCAEHLREQVRGKPPQVATARDFNLWLCGIHNEVNEMLGKPLFDCSRILERWRDGPEDGSCD